MGSSGKRRKEIGNIGEGVAADFLRRKGYKILQRNYWKPWGEIDIIAEKGETLRFIEVKTLTLRVNTDVSRENDYRPEDQLHTFKLQKVARTAEVFMNSNKDTREYQIDVVTVFLDMAKRRAKCRLYEQVL